MLRRLMNYTGKHSYGYPRSSCSLIGQYEPNEDKLKEGMKLVNGMKPKSYKL